jgi:hypothetical protein
MPKLPWPFRAHNRGIHLDLHRASITKRSKKGAKFFGTDVKLLHVDQNFDLGNRCSVQLSYGTVLWFQYLPFRFEGIIPHLETMDADVVLVSYLGKEEHHFAAADKLSDGSAEAVNLQTLR